MLVLVLVQAVALHSPMASTTPIVHPLGMNAAPDQPCLTAGWKSRNMLDSNPKDLISWPEGHRSMVSGLYHDGLLNNGKIGNKAESFEKSSGRISHEFCPYLAEVS